MPTKFFMLSRLLQMLSLLIMAAIPTAILATFVFGNPRDLLLAEALSDATFTPATLPGTAQLWTAMAVSLLQVAVLLFALWQMSRLFANFAAGRIIARQSAQRLFRTGQGLVAASVFSILAQPLRTMLLSWNLGPGQRQLSVGLSSSDVAFLMAGGLLVLVGYAMREAVALRDENRSFV